MTYCAEFFHKYQKDGNFCGLDKSQVSRLNKYLDIAKMLEKQGISEEDIYKKFPLKAAEPLIAARDQARTEGMNYVTSALKRGMRITQKDMQTTLKIPSSESCINATPKPQDPDKCFSPQPGTIEVTDAPPAAPLSAMLKEKYTIAETPVTPIQKEEFMALPPLSKDAPWSEVLKRDALRLAVFTTADQYDPVTGGKLIKREPLKITPAELLKDDAEELLIRFVRGYLTAKDREALGDIMRTGEFGTDYVSMFTGMIWHCHNGIGEGA